MIGDVASNELYYHSGWLKTLNSNYLRIKNNTSRPNDNTDWVKALALNKVIEHIYDTNQNFPGIIFKVKDLELIYLQQLEAQGTSCSSHFTRFTEKLMASVDDLIAEKYE